MNMCDVTSDEGRAAIKKISDGNKCVVARYINGATEVYDLNILAKNPTGKGDDAWVSVCYHSARFELVCAIRLDVSAIF
jgi:hypothetical protein